MKQANKETKTVKKVVKTTTMEDIVNLIKELPVKSCTRKQYVEVLRLLPKKIKR